MDANGDAPRGLPVFHTGGQFSTTNGGNQPGNYPIWIAASDINNLWVSGTGTAGTTDSVIVRAFDGHDWGNWDPFQCDNACLILETASPRFPSLLKCTRSKIAEKSRSRRC